VSKLPVALVGPTSSVARALAPRLAPFLAPFRVSTQSLARFLADRKAPPRIVICPAGRLLREDLQFLEEVRRRALWQRPGTELAGAIAGLRGEHDLPAGQSTPRPSGRGRTSALLLEGDVTRARALRAVDSGAPRHWIVERVQSVRIAAAPLDELRRLGIRWSALEPVEVIAVAASPELARVAARSPSRLPNGVPVWTIGRGTDSSSRGAKDRDAAKTAE
jgi:hypothetical protein